MKCRRAFETDLAAFVLDESAPEFTAFREHYRGCPECADEVGVWRELEAELRRPGAVPSDVHPDAALLLKFEDDRNALTEKQRVSVQEHLAECASCRDELATLRGFDFSIFEQAAGAAPARASADVAADMRRAIARLLAAVRAVFLHPAFAYSLVVLLLVPVVVRYSSLNQDRSILGSSPAAKLSLDRSRPTVAAAPDRPRTLEADPLATLAERRSSDADASPKRAAGSGPGRAAGVAPGLEPAPAQERAVRFALRRQSASAREEVASAAQEPAVVQEQAPAFAMGLDREPAQERAPGLAPGDEPAHVQEDVPSLPQEGEAELVQEEVSAFKAPGPAPQAGNAREPMATDPMPTAKRKVDDATIEPAVQEGRALATTRSDDELALVVQPSTAAPPAPATPQIFTAHSFDDSATSSSEVLVDLRTVPRSARGTAGIVSAPPIGAIASDRSNAFMLYGGLPDGSASKSTPERSKLLPRIAALPVQRARRGVTLRVPLPSSVEGVKAFEVRVVAGARDKELKQRFATPTATGYLDMKVPPDWLGPGRYEIALLLTRADEAKPQTVKFELLVH